ncbi:hypothetical protein C7M84_004016 [Penaeus vannamei]|uniref:Uncharacterized protein n=1 Tax=Penaeus vannamei TaxID=6689 RepID=A0A423TLK6_PENVA|nr:hypothetical protein C7M84_004016 [Penaeus vannamei]
MRGLSQLRVERLAEEPERRDFHGLFFSLFARCDLFRISFLYYRSAGVRESVGYHGRKRRFDDFWRRRLWVGRRPKQPAHGPGTEDSRQVSRVGRHSQERRNHCCPLHNGGSADSRHEWNHSTCGHCQVYWQDREYGCGGPDSDSRVTPFCPPISSQPGVTGPRGRRWWPFIEDCVARPRWNHHKHCGHFSVHLPHPTWSSCCGQHRST